MTLELAVVQKMVSKSQRNLITQDFLDRIEGSISDPHLAEVFKENFITYLSSLQSGKYKLESYIDAVKYVSCKLLGKSNIDSYAIVFPERYAEIMRTQPTQIDSYASMYNNSKLVTTIYQQTIVPTWVLNQPLHQKTLNVLAEELLNTKGKRGLVWVKIADLILQYTKMPETAKVTLDITATQDSVIGDLREVTSQLSNLQKSMLESGQMNLKQIAENNIVEAEYNEVEDEHNNQKVFDEKYENARVPTGSGKWTI